MHNNISNQVLRRVGTILQTLAAAAAARMRDAFQKLQHKQITAAITHLIALPKLDSLIGGVDTEGPTFTGRADGVAGRQAFVEFEGGEVRACDAGRMAVGGRQRRRRGNQKQQRVGGELHGMVGCFPWS